MTTGAGRERKLDLVPTPGEVLAFIGVAYFLWFLAGGSPSDIFNRDGIKGITAAAVGISGGIILHRLLRTLGPRHLNLQRAAPALVLVGLAVAAPFIVSGTFRATQLAAFAYLAIGTVGICVLTGWTGAGSIGNSAFAGIAGYTMAIGMNKWEANPLLAAFLGVVLAALAGLAVGIPSLRLHGFYLAIVTLGIAVIFPAILKLSELVDLTGGGRGLSLYAHKFSPPVDWGWLSNDRWYYFLSMISLGVVLLLAYNLSTSALGRAFRAVRDNEVAAAVMGVHVAQVKLLGFVISATFAGLAGVLLFVTGGRFFSPDSFTVWMSFDFVIAQILGGLASLAGSLLGAFYIIYIGREGLETIGRQTEAGSNVWLFLIGALFGILLALRSGWLSKAVRELGPRLSPRYGVGLFNLLRILTVPVVGLVFTLLVRRAVDADLLDPVAMRGAITGLILVLIVLFVPGGFVSIVDNVKNLTWAQIFAGLRRTLMAPAPVERPAELVAPGARPLTSWPLLGLLSRGINGLFRGETGEK